MALQSALANAAQIYASGDPQKRTKFTTHCSGLTGGRDIPILRTICRTVLLAKVLLAPVLVDGVCHLDQPRPVSGQFQHIRRGKKLDAIGCRITQDTLRDRTAHCCTPPSLSRRSGAETEIDAAGFPAHTRRLAQETETILVAPNEILDFVERFEQQLDSYKSGKYNETQLRREFLDPFFKAIGWDIDNKSGYAELYKDVGIGS